MAVSVQNYSRLRFADLKLIDGVEFWDLLEYTQILPQNDDIFYTVTGNDRIDLLANSFYGDSILWWVIAVANNLELLPTELQEGQTLRIPAPRYVLQSLFTSLKR